MEELTENNGDKTPIKDDTGSPLAFKPSILIKRRQFRRLNLQVDEEKAVSFDEYVRFVSECYGYEVSAGDVMNEILKAHFSRDGGFKQWRTNPNRKVD